MVSLTASRAAAAACMVGLWLALPALGVGTGQFIDSGQLVGPDQPAGLSLALGDLDGDGDLDAVTGSYVQPAVAYLNDGAGVFAPTGQTLPVFLSSRVILADFDGDGDLDAFVLSHSFPSRILFNDGMAGFTEGQQSLGSSSALGADAGDVDGDGDTDLFVTGVDGHVNTVAFNDGAGAFTYSSQNNGPSARSVALGDLDGDGDLDAFLTQAGGPGAMLGNRVLLNDGAGLFADTGQLLGDRFGTDVELADLDGDGDLDAFVANSSAFGNDPANTVWRNDGQGSFEDTGQQLGAADSNDVDLADLDGDGDVDAFVADSFSPETVWLNDGTGLFTGNGQALGDSSAQNLEVSLGDLDGDGDPDAFVLGGSGGGELVYLNVDGAAPCPADLDGDGSVGVTDMLALLAAWGTDPGGAPDLDGDGDVAVTDLLTLLAAWGACP